MIVFRIFAVVAGAVSVGAVMLSAIRTVVLPRSEQVWLSKYVFVGLRKIFDVFAASSAATKLVIRSWPCSAHSG